MINIVLAINDNFVGQAAALIISIHKNTRKDAQIRINIIHSTVTQQHQDIMKAMVKDMENISELNFVDISKVATNDVLDKCLYKTNSWSYISLETFYRLFIPILFPQYDKVLYLDSDTIVCDDLTELYNTDIKNFYVGAVSEPKYFFKSVIVLNNKRMEMKDYLEKKLNITNESYFNAGVLLLNLDEMRRYNIQEKALNFLFTKYPFMFQDQCVLNSVVTGKVKFLDKKYNVYYKQLLLNATVTIIHFTGSIKPWNNNKQNKWFEEYWKYFKLTPFYNEKQEELYLEFKSCYPKKSFIKIVLGKHRYRIKIFHRTFSINPSLYRRSKKKLLSLLSIKK